eukprot:ANDGO_00277.mRNA.1 hypothetical protein
MKGSRVIGTAALQLESITGIYDLARRVEEYLPCCMDSLAVGSTSKMHAYFFEKGFAKLVERDFAVRCTRHSETLTEELTDAMPGWLAAIPENVRNHVRELRMHNLKAAVEMPTLLKWFQHAAHAFPNIRALHFQEMAVHADSSSSSSTADPACGTLFGGLREAGLRAHRIERVVCENVRFAKRVLTDFEGRWYEVRTDMDEFEQICSSTGFSQLKHLHWDCESKEYSRDCPCTLRTRRYAALTSASFLPGLQYLFLGRLADQEESCRQCHSSAATTLDMNRAASRLACALDKMACSLKYLSIPSFDWSTPACQALFHSLAKGRSAGTFALEADSQTFPVVLPEFGGETETSMNRRGFSVKLNILSVSQQQESDLECIARLPRSCQLCSLTIQRTARFVYPSSPAFPPTFGLRPLVELRLHGKWRTEDFDSLATHAGSPMAQNLKVLEINVGSTVAADSLNFTSLLSRKWSSLTEFILHCGPTSHGPGIDEVLTQLNTPALRRLSLSGFPVSDGDARPHLWFVHCPLLSTLHISNVSSGDRLLIALQSSQLAQTEEGLQELSVTHAAVAFEAEELTRPGNPGSCACLLRQLRRLDLSANAIRAGGLANLLSVSQSSKLQCLVIDDNPISLGDALALLSDRAASSGFKHLRSLSCRLKCFDCSARTKQVQPIIYAAIRRAELPMLSSCDFGSFS